MTPSSCLGAAPATNGAVRPVSGGGRLAEAGSLRGDGRAARDRGWRRGGDERRERRPAQGAHPRRGGVRARPLYLLLCMWDPVLRGRARRGLRAARHALPRRASRARHRGPHAHHGDGGRPRSPRADGARPERRAAHRGLRPGRARHRRRGRPARRAGRRRDRAGARAAKRIDVLAACIWSAIAVDELELLDLSYAPPYSGVSTTRSSWRREPRRTSSSRRSARARAGAAARSARHACRSGAPRRWRPS